MFEDYVVIVTILPTSDRVPPVKFEVFEKVQDYLADKDSPLGELRGLFSVHVARAM